MTIEFKVVDDRSKYLLQVMLLVLGLMLSFPILMTEYNIIYVGTVVFFLMLYFMYRIMRIKLVKNWQKVPCQIEESKIIQHKRYDQDNNIPSLDYEASIVYHYFFQDVQYRSKKVGIDTSQYLFKSESMFETDEALMAKSIDYIKGIFDQPHAYVNPHNPKEAVLDNVVSTQRLLRWVSFDNSFGSYWNYLYRIYMTEIKKYNLVYIKRAFCELVSNILIAGIALFVYMIGLRFELYSNQYETLIYLALASVISLPIFDYLSTLYFNRYKNEYVVLHGDKIKIRSTLIFKNSGTEEKVIDKDQMVSVSLQCRDLSCFERIVIHYNDSVLTLFKKDFKVREFKQIKEEYFGNNA